MEHLQTVREQGQSLSCYIRNLIRNDMNRTIPNNSVDALAQAIADKLGAVQVIANVEKPIDDDSPISLEDKMIIDQLF
ncbi:hypothetical protein [Ureibacillus endophyticus]|uniref:Uncharacterized protein n=1 Tax=Ureibacillus endophyticus TaxID=1978490 RepID=A0A494YT95_9BACL|nr:hypothetical protein [Lysinibacillus endophyticus]RKQ13339.1 hypothetical protein D8M03_16295 [Lysinibacillus endophyticus]